MKDVKTKPKTVKRPHRPIKDMKTVMKNQYIRQKAAVKTQIGNSPQRDQKPENYATDTAENTVFGLSDTVYHHSKGYVYNKLRKLKAEKIREQETPDVDLTEDMPLQHSNTTKTGDSVHTDNLQDTKLPQEQRKPYAERTLKNRGEPVSDVKVLETSHNTDTPTPKVQVKTKDYYIKTHQRNHIEPRKTPYRLNTNIPKKNALSLPQSKQSTVLKGNKSTFSLKHSAKTDTSKVKNMAAKTLSASVSLIYSE